MADTLTKAQEKALVWLYEHGGSASRMKDMTYLAAGEIAPVMTGTWKRLREMFLVEYGNKKRLEITQGGRSVAECLKTHVRPNQITERDAELYGSED